MTNLANTPVKIITQRCPLCSANDSAFYHRDKKREYWQCFNCELIFVPKSFHLSIDEEKALYDLHINDPNDLNYRRFLTRFLNPLLVNLNRQSTDTHRPSGLDFGSGPGPTLSLMLKELGFQCENYDLYYAKHEHLLKPYYYDFVTSTEVVEHLRDPYSVFKKLFSLVKTNGYLGIMTKRSDTLERFKHWHYIQDPTHICFYNEITFKWLANEFNCKVIFPENDVAIFQLS